MDKYEKLKDLKKLLDNNLISQDEFQELKREVFDNIEKQSEEGLADNNKIKSRTNNKLFKKIGFTILLILGSFYIFNFASSNNWINISKSNQPKFDAEKEFSNIDNNINKKLTDSVSGYNYQCWLKDGKIIKLNVVERNGENGEHFSTYENYYFKDNIVFAYSKNNVDGLWYEATIWFNNSKIIKEDYGIGSVKTTRKSFEKELISNGLTIQNDIILDEMTNKSKGLLTIFDLSKRYGFDYKTGQNNNISQAQNDSSNDSNSIKQFRDIQLTLMDASLKKAKLFLGEPDKIGLLYMGGSEKNAAIYLNKVNDNGVTKHLVLFLRYNTVEEIYAILDNEKAYFGIHYVEVKNNNFYSNSVLFDKF
jgi:hypothetical protein